jgi:AraC-like DNA-binding protein
MRVQVRAAALSNYAEVARPLGLDPSRMLREMGLSARVLSEPDIRVSAAKVVRLLEASAEKSGCMTFGLRMAELRRLSDLGALSLLLTYQPTMRDILSLIVRYRDLLNEALAINVDDSGHFAIVREELLTEHTPLARQSHELAVDTIFHLCRVVLGPSWQSYRINFTHAPPPDRGTHRRLFGPKVEFEAEFNGMVCTAAYLDQPNPAAEPVMARYAQQFVESLPKTQPGSTALDVRKSIYMLLPLGKASSEHITQMLGFNLRTLQRRLEEEKTSLSELVNGVRHDLAVRYLSDHGHQLTQIAEMLGYAQLSSFIRWFIGEFGVSPLRWRTQRKAQLDRLRRRPIERRAPRAWLMP